MPNEHEPKLPASSSVPPGALSPINHAQALARARRSREIFEMAPIAEHLPFVFQTTGYTVHKFSGQCSVCSRNFESDMFRGRLQLMILSVAHLEASGLCGHCHVLSRFDYRLHDDGAISGLKNGAWQRWECVGGQSSTQAAPAKPLARLLNVTVKLAAVPLFLLYLLGRWGTMLFAWLLTRSRQDDSNDSNKR